MGSVGAMKHRSASRYFQENNHKFTPEKNTGVISINWWVRPATGYTGNRNKMKKNRKFTSITLQDYVKVMFMM